MSNLHSIEAHRNKVNRVSGTTDTLNDEQLICLESACDWVSKLDRQLSDSEMKSLQQWLVSSPDNLQTMLEVAQLWDRTNELNRLSYLFPRNSCEQHVSHSNKWRKFAAASVLVFALLITYLNSFQTDLLTATQPLVSVDIQKNLTTKIGESKTEVLTDGSKITLNTDSLVDIQYTAAARIINLTRGEIHIDVAHDKSRPLSVIVGEKIIQAVGTAFNVEVRGNSVELMVTDGSVLVLPIQAELYSSDSKNVSIQLSEKAMSISKGEKIDLAYHGKKIQKIIKVKPMDMVASLSWRQGNLIFRGESLVEVMTEIGRYSNIEFEIDNNEKLKQVRVAGMFKTGDVTGLLDTLKEHFNIEHETVTEEKIILRLAESKS